MSQPPIFLRRYMPCTLTVEVLRFPDPEIIRVDYRLSMPAFGFDLTAQALLSAEVVERNPNRDDFLLAVGRDAISRSLGVLMDRSLVRPAASSSPTPVESSRKHPAFFGDDFPTRGRFTPADKEILRGYNISPE